MVSDPDELKSSISPPRVPPIVNRIRSAPLELRTVIPSDRISISPLVPISANSALSTPADISLAPTEFAPNSRAVIEPAVRVLAEIEPAMISLAPTEFAEISEAVTEFALRWTAVIESETISLALTEFAAISLAPTEFALRWIAVIESETISLALTESPPTP